MRHIKHLLIQSGLIIGFLLISHPAWSQVSTNNRNETDYYEYLKFHCQNDSKFTSTAQNFKLCDSTFQGDFAQTVKGRGALGLQPSGDGTAPGGVKGRPVGHVVVGGSGWGAVSSGAEDSGLGFLVTALSGDTERKGTVLENGFESHLSGLVLGLDYQLIDSLILGATLGTINDEVDLAGNAGSLNTDSDSQTIYATWVPIENLSLDVYLGNIDSDFDNVRNFNLTTLFVNMEGIITSSYGGEQTIKGASINYDLNIGSWVLGGFLGVDSVDTKMDGYSEKGHRTNIPVNEAPSAPLFGQPTGFELAYPDQEMESATQSAGLRIGYSAEFGWGVLLPSVKVMSVTENKNDARIIPLALVGSQDAPDPVTPFVAQTEEPDRDYNTGSLSIVAALNDGGQLFFEYETRSGHEFLDTSGFTLGGLFEF